MNFTKRKIKALDKFYLETHTQQQGGITTTFSHIHMTNASSLIVGQAFTCTLVPSTGYYLPQVINITGTKSNFGFSYDYTTGIINIASDEVIGDITIIASASPIPTNRTARLQVQKITSDTYANETQYTGEKFILLTIFPTRGSTVTVNYGNVTKTVTTDFATDKYDTGSGKSVFFGTFNGETDTKETPDSGILTISGAYESFKLGTFIENEESKDTDALAGNVVLAIEDWGATRYITNAAFDNCSSISELTTFSPLTDSIGHSAFSKCTNLITVIIPEEIKKMGQEMTILAEGVFSDCTNLKNVTLHGGLGNDEVNRKLSYRLFENCTSLEEINIPEGIEILGREVFLNCTNLKSITIPSSLNDITGGTSYYSAFTGCSSLNNFQVNENSENYSSDNNNSILCNKEKTIIHSYPSASGTLILDKKYEKINQSAFEKNTKLVSIDLNNAILNGNSVFNSCSNLETIILRNSLQTTLFPHSFEDCASLRSVTIPSTVQTFGTNCFKNCTSLTSIPNINNLTSIASSAFSGCSGLTGNITLPKLKDLGTYSFLNCTGLTSVILTDLSQGIYSSTFEGCSSLTSVTIHEGCPSIDTSAFQGCVKLSNINIPDTVEQIYESAFEGCTSLISLTLPASITTLRGKSLSSLTSVKIKATTPPTIYADTFTPGTITSITVPIGYGEAYKTAANWSAFANIIVEGEI